MVVIPERERRDETRWSFSEFCTYLLAVARSRHKLLSYESYPNAIELDGELTGRLTTMSGITADERVETYSLISANTRQGKFFTTEPVRGKTSCVPPRVVFAGKAKVTLGSMFQNVILGDIHSHGSDEIARFSVSDLLAVVGVSSDVLSGVVTGDTTLFVMRTQESVQMDDFPYLPPALLWKPFSLEKAFRYYWYGRYGFQNIEANIEGTPPNTIGRQPTALEQWWINLAIAERHSLLLYRGRRGEELRKISYHNASYPEVSSCYHL